MVFLSFGAGVQSSVMLMMAIRGEIERPDHVIWADTGLESRAVYNHVDWSERQCEKSGIPFHRARGKRTLRESIEDYENDVSNFWMERPPVYAISKKTGLKGVAKRFCTRYAKIKPVQKVALSLMGHKTARTAKNGEAVMLIGISTDEVRRATPSQERWVDREFPLVDPLKMSRFDCQQWWSNHYGHISLPTSSCIICPYNPDSRFMAMKRDAPEDWADAVDLDSRIRAMSARRSNQDVFVHKSYKPLGEADLNEGQDAFDLEDSLYCAGGCGL